MSVDEISEAICKMEWDDLIRVNDVIVERVKHLNKLELQKFKPGDKVKVKDKEGKYHPGMVWRVSGTKVQVEVGRDRPVALSPHLLSKWMQEAEG